MPKLGQEDARSLFLYHVANGKQFTSKEDMVSIEWCVKKCYFSKGDGGDYHYHPLALEALGRQLSCLEEKPSKWVERLSRVWKFNSFLGETNVFDVIRSNFDLLRSTEQTLFVDVGVFLPPLLEYPYKQQRPWIGWKDRLCVFYKRGELEIQSQLDSLKRKGVLQAGNLTSGRIIMHDLYQEFVTLEAVGKLGVETNMWNRKWLLIDGDDGDLSKLEVIPSGRCWQNLSRLSIRQNVEELDHLQHDHCPPANLMTSLEGIEWKYFSNVLVLQLCGLKFVHGSLNLEGMTCLRSLQLHDLRCLERLEGLESLKHLTYFCWEVEWYSCDLIMKTHVVGQFPTSLKYLDMLGQCVLSGCNVLGRCNNLIKLRLVGVEVGVVLDFSGCLSLEVVDMYSLNNLQTLSGLNIVGSTLQALDISIDGIHIPELDQLDGLVQLDVSNCGISWEVPCLISLTKLQVLGINTHAKLAEDCIPHQLQRLYYKRWTQYEAPCLSAFKQLQVLDLSFSESLAQMDGLGDLPALQLLNFTFCKYLKRLPNLSKSKSLVELNLDFCYKLKLHEEDFEMLSTLPWLHLVPFQSNDDYGAIRLDICKRKVFQYVESTFLYPEFAPNSWLDWKEGEFVELELGLLPIKIGTRGIWDTNFSDESNSKWSKDTESNIDKLEDVDEDVDWD